MHVISHSTIWFELSSQRTTLPHVTSEVTHYARYSFLCMRASLSVRVNTWQWPSESCDTTCSRVLGLVGRVKKKSGLHSLTSLPCALFYLNLPIVFPEHDIIPTTGSCSRGNGWGYRGQVDITEFGTPCQAWSSQTPHRHPRLPAHEILGAGHACRNPWGLSRQPWCYTAVSNTRWEYCNVPSCGEFMVMSFYPTWVVQ